MSAHRGKGHVFGGVPVHMHRSVVQLHRLGEPLQQQRPCLPDGGLYDLRGTREVMNDPHTLPSPER